MPKTRRLRIDDIAAQVVAEYKKASAVHGAFNSAHEGYAVLLEEVDELWDEVKNRDLSIEKVRKEAIQVAAMAMRLVHDVCDK
jgi:hypothetical protein